MASSFTWNDAEAPGRYAKMLEGDQEESMSLLSPGAQELQDTMTKKLSAGGASWLETSPDALVKRWQKYIAGPMMGAWEQIVGPMAKRKYNLPGSFYSADASRGMQMEGEQFLQTNLFPSLYSSQENMYNRLFSMASGLSMTPTQENIVDEEYPEFGDYMAAGIGQGVGAGIGAGATGLISKFLGF